jgi:hypothetical protein
MTYEPKGTQMIREELRQIDALVAEHVMKEKDVQFHSGFADMQRKPKDKDLSFAYYPERVLLPFYRRSSPQVSPGPVPCT